MASSADFRRAACRGSCFSTSCSKRRTASLVAVFVRPTRPWQEPVEPCQGRRDVCVDRRCALGQWHRGRFERRCVRLVFQRFKIDGLRISEAFRQDGRELVDLFFEIGIERLDLLGAMLKVVQTVGNGLLTKASLVFTSRFRSECRLTALGGRVLALNQCANSDRRAEEATTSTHLRRSIDEVRPKRFDGIRSPVARRRHL